MPLPPLFPDAFGLAALILQPEPMQAPPTSMLKRALASKALRTLFALALAGLLLFLAFRGIDVADVWARVRTGRVEWVLLAMVCSVVSHVIRGIRWRMLIQPSGYDVKWGNAFGATMIGYLTNYAFPRLGEVARCAVLNRTDGVPMETLIGSVVAERVADMVCLLLLMGVVAIGYADVAGSFLHTQVFAPLLAHPEKIVLLGAALLLALALVYVAARQMQRSGHPAMQRAGAFVKGIFTGMRAAGRVRKPWLFLLLTGAMWVLYFYSTYFCLFAFPFTRGMGYGAGLIVLLFGSLGIVAPVQGGIGHTIGW